MNGNHSWTRYNTRKSENPNRHKLEERTMKSFSALMLFCASLTFAQTDLLYPWVTSNQNFSATIVINNLNAESVTVTLTATRADGTSETVSREVAGTDLLAINAGVLFAGLGDGSGYRVRMTSDASNVQGAFVVNNLVTGTGGSPSQANVVPVSSASNIILFSYLPNDGSGFSAPVVVNTTGSSIEATYYAIQGGIRAAETTRTIGANAPFAEGVNTLFPEVSGDLYVVVEASVPILGAAFIFNSAGEPALANTVAIDAVPGGGQVGPTVSFSADVQTIFNNSCALSGCHAGPSPSSGLSLEAGISHAVIVNGDARQSALPLITPGSLEESYLYQKIDPNGSRVGSRMPIGGSLSAANLQTIATWITEGAANN
jgi:hypothetical protein